MCDEIHKRLPSLRKCNHLLSWPNLKMRNESSLLKRSYDTTGNFWLFFFVPILIVPLVIHERFLRLGKLLPLMNKIEPIITHPFSPPKLPARHPAQSCCRCNSPAPEVPV